MNMFATKLTTATAALALLAIPAFAQESDDTLPSEIDAKSINEMLTTEEIGGTFKIFTEAASQVGLSNMISEGGEKVTLFVPNDMAFAKLPEGVYADLMKPENVDVLRAVINYHLVAGEHPSDELAGITELDTLHGSKVSVFTENGQTTLDDNVHIVESDIEASNGIIHIVDTVFIPD